MKKRLVSLLVITVLMAAMLMGCKGSSASTSETSKDSVDTTETTLSSDETVSKEEPVTLTIWDTFTDGSLGAAQEQIVQAYKESHPNVTVDRVPKQADALAQTLKAAFMAGTAPDIVYYEAGIGTVGNYVQAGYYMDLSDAYDKYGWDDSLMPACREIPSADNFTWGVGNEMETMSLYINQDIFNKLGLEPPKTIEELTKDFKIIKDAGYNVLANTLDSEWYNNMNFIGTILYAFMTQEEIKDCRENDGSWDKESVRKAMDCIKDWLNKGYFPSHPEVDGDQEKMYFAGDYACWITGNWEVGNITANTDFTTEILAFPGSKDCADGGSQVNFAGGAYLVNSATKVKDTALEFIDFSVNKPETAKIWAEVGNTMPAYTKDYGADLSTLGKRVVGLLGDESLQNTAGINMWLGSYSFDFFSTAGQKLAIGSLDTDSFIKAADEAVAADVKTGLTKGSFKVK